MTTTSTNLIIPEVFADLVQAEFKGQTRVLPWAREDNTLEGQPGETIMFPKWNTLNELEDVGEEETLALQTLSQTVGSATIKEAGTAVAYTDKADLTGLGDPGNEAVRQFGILIARKLDTSLIAAAQEETAADAATKTREQVPYKFDAQTDAFDWGTLVDATSQFGDEWEPDAGTGLFIRSEQRAQIMKDSQFIDASKLGAATPVTTGTIGIIGGMPVIVTNRLPENKFFIIRRGALGVLYKRRPIVETDRDILDRKNVITTNVHYAVKRLNDRGVLVGSLWGGMQ